jgi:phage-related minor tail protein
MSDQIGTASIGLAVDSSGVDAGLNQMEATVQRAGRSLSTLGRTGAAAIDDIGAGAGAAAGRVDTSTRSIQNSIQRVTAAAEAGERNTRSYFEALANQRGANVNALRPYLDQLDQVRARQDAAAQAALRGGSAFQSNAQSAAALAASLRQVPAQLTDIVTSIQGGQQPLTVLLQQGGQLRDMFGSAGGAARALGGYLVSLVSPLTVAAAAVVVLGVAYNQGSKEADAYRKSIILTGNAAGVTTSQLSSMAKQASEVAGTQGANAEALAQLVGTGKVGAENLVRFSATAVQSQKLLGIAVEDTVKAFADLAKDPLQASLKLNEQFNYLTTATYKQIKALTDQGRTAEAAKVAQTALADAQDANNKKVASSLSALEKAWANTGDVAKKAWDLMLNVGREDTIDEKIRKAQDALTKANLARYSFTGGTAAEKDADVADRQRQLDRLENIKKVGALEAQYAAEDTKSRDAAIQFDQQSEKYLTRKQQLERDIAAARNLGQQAAQRGEDPAVTEQRIQGRIKAIRSTYADYFNQSIEGQIAAVLRLGAVQEEQAKRALIPVQANNDAGLNSSLDQRAAYIRTIADADEKSLVAEKARLQQRLALTAQETVSIGGQAAQQQKLADLKGQIALKDQQIATRRKQTEADLFVLDVKNYRDIAESYAALYDTRLADVAAIEQQIQAQSDQNAAIGLTAKQLEVLNTRLTEEKAVRLENKAEILDTIVGREDEAESLRKAAQRMRELNQAQIEGVRKAADVEAYNKFWDSIDSAAQSAFSNIDKGGKAVRDRITDSLKSGFEDALYQLTIKQFIINVKAQVTADYLSNAAGAAAAVAGNGTAATAGTPGVIGNVANALNIYKLTSGAGASITAAGNLFGSSAVSAFGAGLSGGTATAEAAAAYAAAGETAVAGGLTAGASVTAALAAIPVWGWAALGAAAIASYLGVFDGAGPESNTSLTFGSNNTAGNISINQRGNEGKSDAYIAGSGVSALGTFGVTQTFWSKAESDQVQSFIKTVSQTDDALASFLTTTEKVGVTSALTSVKTTVQTGAEGSDQNANGALDKVFKDRIEAILGAVDPGLDKLVESFNGTSQALATEAESILQYRQALDQSGESLFGVKVTLQDIAALRQPTELASAALKRVADEFTATNAVATALGKTSLQAFGAVGLASEETRKNLVTLVGGLDQLSSQTASFAQNYLTDAERLAPVSKALDAALASMGLSTIPQTRDQFKALVQSLDLTTENGQKTFAALLDVQDAFAQVHPQIDATAQAVSNLADRQKEQRSLDIQRMEALGNAEGALAAQRADALAALLSDQARITQAQIYATQDAKKAYDALVSVADDALSGLTKSIAAEKDRINAAYTSQSDAIRKATQASVDSAQKSLQAAQTQVQALQTVFGALDSALGSTKIESDTATLGRRLAAQTVLGTAAANPGNLADNKALTEALSTITSQSDSRLFGTFEDYARDQARTNNIIASLKDTAGDQVDFAELSAKRLSDAIDAIQKSGEDQLQQLQQGTQDQLNVLDQTLAVQTTQLDALKGIDNSVKSVSAALASFGAAVGNLKGNPTAQDNVETQIESLYTTLLGRHSDADGLKFWENALSSGVSLESIRADFLKSSEYQGLHPLVSAPPQAQSSMPIQAAGIDQVSALMGRISDPAQNSTTLLQEIQRLNGMIEAQQATLNSIASSSDTAAAVLDAAQKGQPLKTEAV